MFLREKDPGLWSLPGPLLHWHWINLIQLLKHSYLSLRKSRRPWPHLYLSSADSSLLVFVSLNILFFFFFIRFFSAPTDSSRLFDIFESGNQSNGLSSFNLAVESHYFLKKKRKYDKQRVLCVLTEWQMSSRCETEPLKIFFEAMGHQLSLIPELSHAWWMADSGVKIMNFLLTWGDTLQVSVSCFPGCSGRLNKVLGCFYTAQHVKGNVRNSVVFSGKTVFHTLLLSNFHQLFMEKISHGCQIAGTVPN